MQIEENIMHANFELFHQGTIILYQSKAIQINRMPKYILTWRRTNNMKGTIHKVRKYPY